jgi:hypothetical protein
MRISRDDEESQYWRRQVKEKGAGANPAPLRSGLIVLLRFAENDPAACDREQVELQGQALLVFPCRADAVPELLFPALRFGHWLRDLLSGRA